MTQPEYEQKRAECWEEYLSEHKTTYTRTAFDFAFDRAYGLGKLQASCGQVKETISQEEIEKAAEKYVDELSVTDGIPDILVPLLYDIAKSAYINGALDFIYKAQIRQRALKKKQE